MWGRAGKTWRLVYNPRSVLLIIPPTMTTNVGVFTNPKHDLYTAEIPDAGPPGPEEVTVHVIATGICGSDCHFQHDGAIGDAVVKGEHILGHESAGVVTKVGSNVQNLKVGDRVSMEPGTNCGVCEFCKTGAYNGCVEMEFKSTPPYPGLMCRYLNHPARLCYNIGHLSYEEGALLEPLSVGLAGVEQSGLKLGDPCVVAGAGPIGIITALLAKASGAAPLAITDLNPARLKLAEEIIPGILTVHLTREDSPEEAGRKIVATIGQKARVALECTGFEPSIAACLFALKFRGVCEIIGVGKDEIKIPFMHFSFNEMTIKGLFRYTNTWPRGIRLLQSGAIDVKKLVSFKYDINDAQSAFKKASDPHTTGIKTMVVDKE